ncbi:hypothetical protein VOLCADRAFT_95208 [Volvox carteri f. nagariensis]|uniref:Nudix hydrolase domain-containing protein n=1 Tax=Volvox carteri f. nagariensis TaxID=3068 RepID=D8U6W7_VOLCA|nr:uncharacterized protein VOLCADRAFT_95208 [Volvox carteri f. nagariensis]EFJ44584.1 hypothetical protein VOLCADRAFT_95208 [Volvox carteri f. nagariensis]|eukprot:XP_002954434.1 hypothetical protein VOLCADRAFT_95208 [Volvox carteri f. nagariensis]
MAQHDKHDVQCPACRRWTSRLTRHINLYHGVSQLVDERTGVFALAVVRRPEDGKFLMVQERYGEGYWLPGGGADPGESLREAVVREVWEEAGADIRVTGILTVESLHRVPDVESVGACWVRAEEVESLPLRNPSEPLTWIPWVASGGKVLPLDPEAFPVLAQVFPDFPL